MNQPNLPSRLPLPGFGNESRRWKLPLEQRLKWNRYLALKAMCFLEDETKSKRIQERLVRFVRAFVGDHDGLTVRKPNKKMQLKLKEMIKAGEDVSNVRLFSAAKSINADCDMKSVYAQKYWVDRRKSRGRILDGRAYQKYLGWDELYRHLLGDKAGPLHLRWYYLSIRPAAVVSYFVLDLDDKGDQLLWPKAPRAKVRDMLRFLARTRTLDPARAVMVSSPGGRGRHLYYFLDRPQIAAQVNVTVLGFLRWQWWTQRHEKVADLDARGLEVFPKPGDICVMPPLPLGRGSVLCDARGRPDKVGNIRSRLLAVLRDVKRVRGDPVKCDELRLSDFAREEVGVVDEPAVPASDPRREPIARVPSIGTPSATSVSQILRRGITGPGQRRVYCQMLLADHRDKGSDAVAAIPAVQAWLKDNHHGFSNSYNADPQMALNDVGVIARSVFTERVPALLQLETSQVSWLFDRIVVARQKGKRHAKVHLRNRLKFAAYFFAQLESFACQSIARDDEGECICAPMATKVMAGFPGGAGITRRAHIDALRRLRLLRITRKHVHVPFGMRGSRATTYALPADYPRRNGSGELVQDACIRFLSESGRWKILADKQAWRRLRSEKWVQP